MNMDDKRVLIDCMRSMFMLIETQREIATIKAKNQNAPKYLYEQASDIKDKIIHTILMED